MGEHLAARRTSGIEFSDYREYSAGDDLRRVDWNAYARLGSLHVRQAQAEHDTVLHMLVDASPSMEFGRPTKFFAARRLAAALGYIALAHLDAVVLAAPGAAFAPQPGPGTGLDALSPLSGLRGRAQSATLFRYLQEMRPGSAVDFDSLLAKWGARRVQGRVAVLISDLLLDGWRDGLRSLAAAGFRVNVFHLLSADEISPPDRGQMQLVDSETGRVLEINLGPENTGEYARRLDAWLLDTEQWCRSQGAAYFRLRSDRDIERLLLDTLRRGGVTQ
jgi:uncharacterized protein (DUF58 family)